MDKYSLEEAAGLKQSPRAQAREGNRPLIVGMVDAGP